MPTPRQKLLLLLGNSAAAVTPTYTSIIAALVQAGRAPGWWKFNELSGTMVINAGYALAAADGVWTPGTGTLGVNGAGGTPNEAYTYDGANSRVAVPSNALFKAQQFTIACLVKPTSSGEGTIGALFNYSDAHDTAGRFAFAANALTFSVGAGTTTGIATTNGGGANPKPTLNDWQFLFFDLDSDKLPRIYKGYQGVLTEFIYATQTAWAGTFDNSAILALGNVNTQSRTFAGGYDEAFYVQSPKLSVAEMLDIVLKKGV